MVAIKYKGQNYIMVNGIKFVNGINEISDEVFYKLMTSKLFEYRVRNRIFEVPPGFPLEKPVKPKDPVEDAKPVEAVEEPPKQTPLKDVIRSVNASDDLEYIESILASDDRQKVKEACQARIEVLTAPEPEKK